MSETVFFEKKTAGFAVSMKELSPDSGGDTWTIAGYGSTFGGPDLVGDVIEPGSFSESLRARPELPILWQHDTTEPIGRTLFMAQDEHGLLFKAKLDPTRRGNDAKILTSSGSLTGVSIGYNAESRPGRNGVKRVLSKIDLYELSLVSFPANPAARLSGGGLMKSALWDSLTIAEVDRDLQLGNYVSQRRMIAYIEAQQRALEAQQKLYELAYELQELEKIRV